MKWYFYKVIKHFRYFKNKLHNYITIMLIQSRLVGKFFDF